MGLVSSSADRICSGSSSSCAVVIAYTLWVFRVLRGKHHCENIREPRNEL